MVRNLWLFAPLSIIVMLLLSLTTHDHPTQKPADNGGKDLSGIDIEAGYEYQKQFCPEDGTEYVNGICPDCGAAPQTVSEYYDNYGGRKYILPLVDPDNKHM